MQQTLILHQALCVVDASPTLPVHTHVSEPLADLCRREITVRGMFVTTSSQRSNQQAETTAVGVSNAPVSLDDVDTVLSNLEGLCSEEQSWATQDIGLEQCIQVCLLKGIFAAYQNRLVSVLFMTPVSCRTEQDLRLHQTSLHRQIWTLHPLHH